MDKWLYGLVGINAVTSSAILASGKNKMATMVGNTSTYWSYGSLGVSSGANSSTSASVNNTGLGGNNTYVKDCNVSYEANYKAVWSENFSYSNTTDHKFVDAVICRNESQITDYSLARICYDTITLNTSDSLALTIKVAF